MRLFKQNAKAPAHWKVDEVVAALRKRYPDVQKAEFEDAAGALHWYAVQFGNLKFAVGLLQTAPNSGDILEIGLLAVFNGFEAGDDFVIEVNRLLHISVLSGEPNGRMLLLFNLGIQGAYDDKLFQGVLHSWERDLMLTIQKLSGATSSFSALFPMAQSEIAQQLALNANPAADNGADLVTNFLGAKAAAKTLCDDCGGRGKRGLIARMCGTCGGDGFVEGRR